MNEQWKQLKETIIEIRDNNKFDHKDVSSICQFLANYMNILEERMSNSESLNKWIPVSERMPNPGEYNGNVDRHYLVQNEYDDMLVARYTKKECWEQIFQIGEIKEKIVAWQPLPKPYEAESEEEHDNR